jgi:hypothetical protein
MQVRASGAQLPNFFAAYEEVLRSSFGGGWLELAIADWRFPIDSGGSCHAAFSINNRQSAIGNENLVFGCGPRALPRSW